ncbi:MAG: NAD(P)/FAD-dependent oxidoreductase [Anaerolineae bacterium]|nr:NAD(P)/FAD-dependent oxidoreductase [Anaerolineae bacterium]
MVVGDLATNVEVLVLGAGPGGCSAALRAAQLGKEVLLVDPDPLGGGMRAGGLAAETLLEAAGQIWQLNHWSQPGITVTGSTFDWSELQAWKNSRVEALSAEIKRLLDQYQVEVVTGQGWFLAENEARVESEYESKRYLFDQAVIAVGGEAAPWPDLPFDHKRVLTPVQALALAELPAALTLIGADYLAAELATLFAKLGVSVRVLLPTGQRLLPEFDPAAGEVVQARLQEMGVKIENLTGLEDLSGLIIVSAGLTPRTTQLGLDKAKVTTNANGFIQVNDRQQTGNPAIYAVGDVTGGPPLAYVAAKQGKVAAENIAGKLAQFAPQAIPRVARTDPEVAAVGLTASEAETAGYHVSRITYHVSPSTGFVELVAEQENEVLLGVTIVGPQAGVLIGEAALALEMGATLTDLAETLHPAGGDSLAKAAVKMIRDA